MEGFKLSEYIKSGLLEAVGKLPNFKIKIASIKWLLEGKFIELDLIDINKEINGSSEFKLNVYAKESLIEAIGNLPSYEIKMTSLDWLEKGILLEEDLAEIQSAIDRQNIVMSAIEMQNIVIPEE